MVGWEATLRPGLKANNQGTGRFPHRRFRVSGIEIQVLPFAFELFALLLTPSAVCCKPICQAGNDELCTSVPTHHRLVSLACFLGLHIDRSQVCRR